MDPLQPPRPRQVDAFLGAKRQREASLHAHLFFPGESGSRSGLPDGSASYHSRNIHLVQRLSRKLLRTSGQIENRSPFQRSTPTFAPESSHAMNAATGQ